MLEKLKTAVGAVLTADLGVALRLRYVGSGESAPDYADAVLVSATSLTLSVNGVADSTVGATGVLAFATYTTLGSLVDAINLSANWEAEIVAGLRSDSTASSVLLARSTSAFRPYQEVSLFWDSSACKHISFCVEPKVGFSEPILNARVGLKRVIGIVNTSDSGAYDISAYELGPDKASSLRTLYNVTPADNTADDSGALDEPFVHAGVGRSILVRVSDASWADSGAYLKVYAVREE